jgi:hypothetical protein
MKKSAFVFLITLLSFLPSQSKDFNDRIPKHKTKFSIGLTYSPDIYVYNFKSYSDFSFSYNSKYNYSTGLTLVYYPVKILSIRGAFLYSTKGFGVDYNYKSSVSGIDPDSLPSASTLKADYLDFPIILHLNIIHRDRIQLFLAAGVVPGVLMKKAEQTLFKSNNERDTENLSKHFNDFIAGTIYSIGFKYNFSAKLGIGFDPYIRYYLNKIDRQSMEGNPVSFGGKISLYINFIHKQHRGTWGQG